MVEVVGVKVEVTVVGMDVEVEDEWMNLACRLRIRVNTLGVYS